MVFSRHDGEPNIHIMDDDGTDIDNITENPNDIELRPSLCGNAKAVFESDANGTYDIFIVNLDGSSQTNLTSALNGSHERDPHCELISGELWIVYASNVDDNDYEIYKMKSDGSSKTRLTNDQYPDSGPAWCKGYVIFSRDVEQDDPDNCSPATTQDEIFIMDPDGSDQRQLTADCHGDFLPSCNPDGDIVAFQRFISYAATSEIFTIEICAGSGPCDSDLSDPGVTRLTTTSNDNDTEPTWSPGGDVIAMASDRPSPSATQYQGTTDYEIYKIDAFNGEEPLAGGFLTQVTDTASGVDDRGPHWGETRP
jgi:Tol biopolymer transport system component